MAVLRILHLVVASGTQLLYGIDVGQECVAHHLDRLTVQSELALGSGLSPPALGIYPPPRARQ
jgi:hypothetical protein